MPIRRPAGLNINEKKRETAMARIHFNVLNEQIATYEFGFLHLSKQSA